MTDAAPSSAPFSLPGPAETPRLGGFFGTVAMVPFALGTPAFAFPEEPRRGAALAVLLILGYLGPEIPDPIAARRLEAPLSFARLRPARMAVPVSCPGAALVLLLLR